MKKKLLLVTIAVLALSALFTGVAAAEEPLPPADPTAPYSGFGRGGGRMGGGFMMGIGTPGLLHDYMEVALADQLGLTETQVEEAFAAGSTLYQIALDNGILEADLPTFLSEVHAAALAQAVSDGVLTQEQADLMLERMAQHGTFDGTGAKLGRGGMGRGTCIRQTTP